VPSTRRGPHKGRVSPSSRDAVRTARPPRTESKGAADHRYVAWRQLVRSRLAACCASSERCRRRFCSVAGPVVRGGAAASVGGSARARHERLRSHRRRDAPALESGTTVSGQSEALRWFSPVGVVKLVRDGIALAYEEAGWGLRRWCLCTARLVIAAFGLSRSSISPLTNARARSRITRLTTITFATAARGS
jgi:hypothetical protein